MPPKSVLWSLLHLGCGGKNRWQSFFSVRYFQMNVTCCSVDWPPWCYNSKDAFEVTPPNHPVSGINGDVMKRCWGKQTPSNPHGQRLLVASAKEAEKGKAKGGGKGKGKGCKGPQKKTDKTGPAKKVKADAAPKKPTEYSAAKAKFIEEFLVWIISFSNMFTFWLSLVIIGISPELRLKELGISTKEREQRPDTLIVQKMSIWYVDNMTSPFPFWLCEVKVLFLDWEAPTWL